MIDRRKVGRIISSTAFPAIIAVIVLIAVIFRNDIAYLFSSRSRLQDWIDGFGVYGPLVFIAVQLFQVVVFIVPGEVAQIAGGYLFGTWAGIVYSVVGIMIGSAFNFYVARFLGTSFVEGLFKPDRVEKFESIISSSRARVGFFLFFLIPGIPKDILCYLAGLSRISFTAFLLISMAGRFPGIVGSTIIGSSAAKGNWLLTFVVTAAAVLLFVVGVLLRPRLHAAVERIISRRHD